VDECKPLHVTQRTLRPCLLSELQSYDVASTICQALPRLGLLLLRAGGGVGGGHMGSGVVYTTGVRGLVLAEASLSLVVSRNVRVGHGRRVLLWLVVRRAGAWGLMDSACH